MAIPDGSSVRQTINAYKTLLLQKKRRPRWIEGRRQWWEQVGSVG